MPVGHRAGPGCRGQLAAPVNLRQQRNHLLVKGLVLLVLEIPARIDLNMHKKTYFFPVEALLDWGIRQSYM